MPIIDHGEPSTPRAKNEELEQLKQRYAATKGGKVTHSREAGYALFLRWLFEDDVRPRISQEAWAVAMDEYRELGPSIKQWCELMTLVVDHPMAEERGWAEVVSNQICNVARTPEDWRVVWYYTCHRAELAMLWEEAAKKHGNEATFATLVDCIFNGDLILHRIDEVIEELHMLFDALDPPNQAWHMLRRRLYSYGITSDPSNVHVKADMAFLHDVVCGLYLGK